MKNNRIPRITIRSGQTNKPVNTFLVDVLNYIDTADIRHVQIISAAIGERQDAYLAKQPWTVTQNNKVRRAAV